MMGSCAPHLSTTQRGVGESKRRFYPSQQPNPPNSDNDIMLTFCLLVKCHS